MGISKETIAGLFVVAGLICLTWLTVKLGRMELFGTQGITVTAAFSSVSGLRAGAEVQVAGVSVGRVTSIRLDETGERALVTMQIDSSVRLADDAIASVKTSGLIGDKYINLSPGGSGEALGDGGEIVDTESAVDIEELISKYVFGKV